MGPLNTNYKAEPAAAAVAAEIYHFAHHHPLQLSHHHNQQIPCSACTHPTSTPAYGCQHCNYYLHVSCSRMPQQLQHPFDTNKTHTLKLHPKTVYPEGLFGCDACGHQGSGFSYHCADCKIDLHVLCAALPAVASVPGHEHQLTRVFRPPYANNQFVCDVCRQPGSKTWLYHCATCQFDVHLGCTRGTQKARVPERAVSYPPTQARYHHQQPHQNGYSNGHGQPVMGQPANNQVQYYNNQPVAKQAGPQIFNSIAEGAMNGLAQAVVSTAVTMGVGAIIGGDPGAGAGADAAGGFTFE